MFIFRTRVIITCGLYTLHPLFEVDLGMYCDLWPYVWLLFKSGARTVV